MALTVRQIEAFRAVMLCGSTKAAADMLHVSQPVVSKLIAQLELQLGYALFERKANAILPNQAAAKLLDEAVRVHERVEQFARFARTLKQTAAGSLSLCISATFASGLVPRLLARYRERNPEVSVRISNHTVSDFAQTLVADPDAMGISIWPVDDPRIDCEILASRPVRVLMRSDHRLARRRTPLALEDLGAEPLILHSNSMPLGDAIRAQLARLPIDWRIPYTVNSSETAYGMVEKGLGLSFCDALAAEQLRPRRLVARDVAVGVSTYVCLLRSRYHASFPHVDACMDLLRNELDGL